MASAKEIIGGVLAIVLGLYVVSAMVPDALTTIMDINTTGWDATVATLWAVLPIMAVLAIVVILVTIVLDRL